LSPRLDRSWWIAGLALASCGKGPQTYEIDEKPRGVPFEVDWEEVPPGLADLDFADGLHGWAVGPGGRILATIDGRNWTPQASGTKSPLEVVDAIDASTAWAAGKGVLLRTRDGGLRWESVAAGIEPRSLLEDVTWLGFRTVQRGWLLAREQLGQASEDEKDDRQPPVQIVCFATEDGGEHWERRGAFEYVWPARPQIIGEETIALITKGGDVVRTDDAGRTWVRNPSTVPLPPKARPAPGDWAVESQLAVEAFCFLDTDRAWISGDAGDGRRFLCYTKNGGESWEPREALSPEPGVTLSIAFVDDDRGWILARADAYEGPYLLFSTTDGGAHWRSKDLPQTGDLERIVFRSASAGWILDENGVILATTDGGESWSPRVAVHPKGSALDFADASHGWIAGPSGVWSTTNAGETWSLQMQEPGLLDVDFVDPQNGWTVGTGGRVFATRDGGRSWAPQHSGIERRLAAVCFVDRDCGWAVGDDGTILGTTSGGVRWTAQESDARFALHDGAATDPEHAWAVGDHGWVASTQDGGRTWRSSRWGDDSLVSVSFAGPRVGWTVGGRSVLATDDAGRTWSRTGFNWNVEGVCFANATTGWIFGTGRGSEGDPYAVVEATTNAGSSWESLAYEESLPRDAARFSFPSADLGFAIGRADDYSFAGPSFYRARRTGEGPYVSGPFTVSEHLGSTKLQFRVGARGDAPVSIAAVHFKTREDGDWRFLSVGRRVENPEQDPHSFEFTWDPSEEMDVAPGTTLHYRITLEQGEWRFPQEIPHGFEYLPWWERQPPSVQAAWIGAGIVGLYLMTCGALWLLHPSSVLGVYRRLPLREIVEGLAPSGFVRPIIVAALDLSGIPRLAESERVRLAWIGRYAAGTARLSDLDARLRAAYLRHADVLDAWVERRRARAEEALERIEAVGHRRVYVPLPVRVGERERGDRMPSPSARELRRFFASSPAVVAIVGAGGSGKSTLAFALARWSLSADRTSRLMDWTVLPVVVDEDTEDLVATVGDQLRRLIGPEEVEDDVVASLLEHKRLLVIVDALSERASATQRHVVSIHARAAVNALVVTTRRPLSFGPVAVSELHPEPLDADRIVYFAVECLQRTDRAALFSGPDVLHLCQRLMAGVPRGGGGAITPLLVELFVANAAALREKGRRIDELPPSFPEAVLEFVRRLNPKPSASHDGVPDELVVDAALAVARSCMEPDFVPHDVESEGVEVVLDSRRLRGDGLDPLARLIENGLLERRERAGTRSVRFVLDPVAEYLAAIDHCRELRADGDAWRELLRKLKATSGYPESIRGFLSAIEDCMTTYREDFRIPELELPWRSG